MTTPLRAIGRGALAGYAGMAVMAGIVGLVGQLKGGGDDAPPRTWKEAQPPAEFAHRVITGVAKRKVSVQRAPLLNNVMHAIYAPLLGGWYGIFQESLRPRPLPHGLVHGSTVWGMRAALLPTLQLADPVWRWPPGKVAGDAAFHVAFGLAVAYAYRGLERVSFLA
jgi:hypothetical protein